MAGFLGVDVDVLGKTVQSLRGVEQVLGDAMKAMARGGHGDIGTKELNDAADSFQRRWHFGIERIGEAARVTADGVARCHDAYQQVDKSFAKALGQAEAVIDGNVAHQDKA
ncbi:hypothetical protein [Nocardia pneumoniae]|uniref:hypothetical protein n=1 Tax=Nocardia pneumoniae TaxID=228601 RepID=UPI000313E56C|nr:hypothetical protein [Nocardia pneumoniae]